MWNAVVWDRRGGQNAATAASSVTHSLVTLIVRHARWSPLLGQAWKLTDGSRYVVVAQPLYRMHRLSSGRYNANWVKRPWWIERPGMWFLWSHCGAQFHLDCHNKTILFIKYFSGSVPKREPMWTNHKYKLNRTKGDVGNIPRKLFSLVFSVSESLVIYSSRYVLLLTFIGPCIVNVEGNS